MTDTLLPYNATANERALEGAAARVSDVPVLVREAKQPESCPAALLPWLASEYSVDVWDTTWTEAQKRQMIRDSVFVHRMKGTIGAVRGALASLGFAVQVQEWFNQIPAGTPYTYRLLLEVSQTGISQDDMQTVSDVVEQTKNLRSHLDSIVPIVLTQTGPVVAGACGTGNEIVVAYQDVPDVYLLTEGAVNGDAATEAAVDALHTQLHTTMTTANYW